MQSGKGYLNLVPLPEMLRPQTCNKSRSHKQNDLEAKEGSESPTCKILESPKSCVHILFLKESVPKLYKHVKPDPSPARCPGIWSHYYGMWRTDKFPF